MKRRTVRWSEDALADLDEQDAYIARDNEEAAQRTHSRLAETAANLGISPTGRPGHEPGTYEKVVTGTPYIIIYELPDDVPLVKIMRVYHGAQNWWGDN